jgi:hypothetical protein
MISPADGAISTTDVKPEIAAPDAFGDLRFDHHPHGGLVVGPERSVRFCRFGGALDVLAKYLDIIDQRPAGDGFLESRLAGWSFPAPMFPESVPIFWCFVPIDRRATGWAYRPPSRDAAPVRATPPGWIAIILFQMPTGISGDCPSRAPLIE